MASNTGRASDIFLKGGGGAGTGPGRRAQGPRAPDSSAHHAGARRQAAVRRGRTDLLCRTTRSVSARLNDLFDVAPPTMSHHLKLLREAGLIGRPTQRRVDLLLNQFRGDGLIACGPGGTAGPHLNGLTNRLSRRWRATDLDWKGHQTAICRLPSSSIPRRRLRMSPWPCHYLYLSLCPSHLKHKQHRQSFPWHLGR